MPRMRFRLVALIAMLVMAAAGCGRRTSTEPWPPITDPLVFDDTFGKNVIYQAFGGSRLDALAIDSTTAYTGKSSMKISVPSATSTTGTYAGGALTTPRLRDLAGYNAVSFWMKGSVAATLAEAGFGNDNTGKSRYTASRSVIPVTTSWTQVLVPIPNAAKLTAEGGLFYFSAAPLAGAGWTLWIDDVQFVNTATITNPRPALASQTINTVSGAGVSLSGTTKTVFAVNGVDQTVGHMPGYFDFFHSAPAFGSVTTDGILHVASSGTDTLTAKLGTISATGRIVVNAIASPTTAAPNPTVAAGNVISLFSDVYSNVPVDTWNATWSQAYASESDLKVAGNPVKLYTNLTYAGIEFTTHTINASAMTAFHMDVYVPSGSTIKVKLVDFGANGVYGPLGSGNDDTQSELTFTAPASLTVGAWYPLEIPLANFTTLTNRAHLAQLIISGDLASNTRTVFVDNIYFHK